MNSKYLIGIVAVAIIIVTAGLIFISGKKTQPTTTQTQPTTTQTQQTTVAPSTTEAKEYIISVLDTGFSPALVTIKPGDRVIWVNRTSGAAVTVNSADHPTHQVYPPLNLGEFKTNQSVQLVFNEVRAYKYHNHLNPSQTGIIVVKSE